MASAARSNASGRGQEVGVVVGDQGRGGSAAPSARRAAPGPARCAAAPASAPAAGPCARRRSRCQAHRRVDVSSPTRRSPRALTQTPDPQQPQRERRSRAPPRRRTRPRRSREPARAMISAEKSTYEASSSSSAPPADPPGARAGTGGASGHGPCVRQRDRSGPRAVVVDCAVGRQEGQGHGMILTHTHARWAVPGEAIERLPSATRRQGAPARGSGLAGLGCGRVSGLLDRARASRASGTPTSPATIVSPISVRPAISAGTRRARGGG